MSKNEIRFSKVLARYYFGWFADCHESATYCMKRGDDARARKHLDNASKYLTTIMENWEAIEFFSIGDNAHYYDSTLPEQFRGYE